MSGDPANTAVWGDADVLVAPISATIPVGNAAFSVDWEFIGLLDGSSGFTESVETSATDHSAWGAGVVATTYGDQKTTKTFTSLEDNETVLSLLYDTSGTIAFTGGDYVGDLGVKDFTSKVRIAFVTRSGTNEKRMISKNYATVAASGAAAESEDSLQSKEFTATIYPSVGSVLWYSYKGVSA